MRTGRTKPGYLNWIMGCEGRARTAFCLFCLWPALILLFTGCPSHRGRDAAKPFGQSRGKPVCWILINFDSLFCSPCLAPLLEFCRSLPDPIQKERIRGILVFSARPDREPDGLYARIVQKKMHGFAKANDLRFPIVLDGSHVFNGLVKSNTQALLFDDEKQNVKAYAFPLKPEEQGEIMRFLLN